MICLPPRPGLARRPSKALRSLHGWRCSRSALLDCSMSGTAPAARRACLTSKYRFTWGLEMTCKVFTSCSLLHHSTARTEAPLLRLHTLPPPVGSHQIQNFAGMDCRSSFGPHNAARCGCLIRPLDFQVWEKTTFHDWRLYPGRRRSSAAWVDARACRRIHI
jgi:hypothetical protein